MDPMLTIAVRAAREAGRILLRNFENVDRLKIQSKGRNDFVTEVDQRAEIAVIKVLREKYPGHAILAEETGAHPGRDEYEWVIDPLDGTTNYLHGFPQFAVSIACKIRGKLEQAVVYDPLREEMFTATRGRGAQLNDRRIRVSDRKSLDGALLGTGFPFREHQNLDLYMQMFRLMVEQTAGLRRPGSAALDLAYTAAGRTDGFFELGLSQWDFAGGALLVSEAGGMVTDIDGGGGFLDSGNLLAANLKIHAAMLKNFAPLLKTKPARPPGSLR